MSLKCKQCGKCFSQATPLKDMKKFILGKSLMNVKSVASVLGKQQT